ncbi:MAG TPA: SAM-dependent methyltransferase [Pseudonocardiaceae bacterium]|nr:SAM-dependent methyltransferase [Pseudonocardiaceae bacterium]
MDISQINAIGRTAWEVAALRAAESERPDRLFTDPYAALFLDAAGIPMEPDPAKQDLVAILGEQAAVRTRFLDETLLAAGCRQAVLVASGMDSRAYRLEWPAGTEVFELDQEPVLRFKQEVMVAHPARAVHHPVDVDLRADWPPLLRQAGFRPDEPTAWLAEGLLYALDAGAADGLLDAITGLSAPGSVLAFDHVQDSAALRAALTRISPGLAALWQSGPIDPEDWLRGHGWTPEVSELAQVANSYGRGVHPAYDPATEGAAHSWLARATRT